MVCGGASPPAPLECHWVFQQGRLLFEQLGLTAWEKRTSVHTLQKNDKLLR